MRRRRSTSPGPSGEVIFVNIAMLWLSMAIAGLALWPIYESFSLVIVVAAATVAGSAIALCGALWRWRAWLIMIVTVLVFFAIGVPVAVPSETQFGFLPTTEGFFDLITGATRGWKQLLTILLPVGDYESLLVPSLMLVLVTATLGLSLALRSRLPEFAVLAPIGLYLVAVAFGSDKEIRAAITPIALLIVVLLWLVWFRWHRRRTAIRLLTDPVDRARSSGASRRSGVRLAVAAILILAISSGAAVAVAEAIPPAEDRTVLRSTVRQAFDPRSFASPLSGFREYWREGVTDSVLFEVPGVVDGQRIRLATLDSYNGIVFSLGSEPGATESGFTRVPSSFDQSAVAGDPVSLKVRVVDYSGPWLPTIGQFETIRFSGATANERRDAFFYDDLIATAAVLGGLASGDSYELTAIAPSQPDDSALESLEPGSALVPEATGVPEEISATLERYTTSVSGAGPQLKAMLDGLATEGYISHGSVDEPPSRSGHAADRIAELLGSPLMVGDAEQYAVAAALMARDLGFPSRVVIGFEPKDGQIFGKNVAAWIEVNTAQYGWVTIDPNPEPRDIPEERPKEKTTVALPPTIVPPLDEEQDETARQVTPDIEREFPDNTNSVLQIVLAIATVAAYVVLAVALILVPFVIVIAAKARRRRLRRRARTPAARITGGWREFEDSVIDHGFSPGASATRSEIAQTAGGVPSQVLAAVTDRVTFSPDEPDSGEAESVWRAVDELRASLNQGKSRWQRVRARISLRSLGGYSVRKIFMRQKRLQ